MVDFSVHDPLDDGISSLRLLDYMGSAIDIINDARQSFDAESPEFTSKDQKLLNYLVAHKHTSPFRGVVFKWQVKAPLFVARQWWKHVIGGTYANDQLGWNEKSFRYCVADSDEFYVPANFRKQSKSNKQASDGLLEGMQQAASEAAYTDALFACATAYKTLIEAGVCKEQARGVLPTCTYTSFVWTCSLQAFKYSTWPITVTSGPSAFEAILLEPADGSIASFSLLCTSNLPALRCQSTLDLQPSGHPAFIF